jgi:hypothetical protein
LLQKEKYEYSLGDYYDQKFISKSNTFFVCLADAEDAFRIHQHCLLQATKLIQEDVKEKAVRTSQKRVFFDPTQYPSMERLISSDSTVTQL